MGFDTKGAGSLIVKGNLKDRAPDKVKIPDSREGKALNQVSDKCTQQSLLIGWVESVRLLLDSYFLGTGCPEFDYSQIRLAGLPIKVNFISSALGHFLRLSTYRDSEV